MEKYGDTCSTCYYGKLEVRDHSYCTPDEYLVAIFRHHCPKWTEKKLLKKEFPKEQE